jgi:hypothetical protein
MGEELTARHIAEDYFRVWGYDPYYPRVANFVDDYWPKSYTDHGITYQEVFEAALDVMIEELEGLRS